MRRATLIGVPTDIGASSRGASMGPEAMRVAGIAEMLVRRGVEVRDCGNISGPANPGMTPVEGYRHLDEVSAWNQAVHDAVFGELSVGRFPIMLGGDHCLAVGSVSAVARYCREQGKTLRVLWLDAHSDFNTNTITPSGNMHGMPVACLCGFGPDSLTGLSGKTPAVTSEAFRLVGIRSVDDGEREFIRHAKLKVFDMRSIDELGMREVMHSALEGMDDNTHLHVSFDVDFLDPVLAPGVGTTIHGGPTYREAQLCMEMIADTGSMASLDVMELNPALDVRNQTAELAVELIESLFGKSTLIR